MKILSTIWSTNEKHINGFIPLEKLVSIYREQKQIHDPIYFLVLDGWSLFEHKQKSLLEKNCFLIDAQKQLNQYKKKYVELSAVLQMKYGGGSEFLMNNLMRWFIMTDFADNSDFLHTDCDLVLNVDTSMLEYDHSIYMDSTCLVYVKNSEELKGMYTHTLDKLITDNRQFIKLMHQLCSDELWKWGQGNVSDKAQINEEILFYWMTKLFKLNWSDPRHKMLYMPFMQSLVPDYGLYPEILRPLQNRYSFVHNKHYINEIPLTYMHYQQNMRMLLAVYTIQHTMGIPDEYKYGPEAIHFFSAINEINQGDIAYLTKPIECRHKDKQNNMAIDLLILYLIEFVTKNQIGIAKHPSLWYNADLFPANLTTTLDFEYTGWGSILNNNFWFAEGMFV